MKRTPSSIHLDRVASLDDIRGAIRVFNAPPFDSDLHRELLRDTIYWVKDSLSGTFGPGKFCGFRNLNSAQYQQARDVGSAGAAFQGGTARKAIERVAGFRFRTNSEIKRQFIQWATARFGNDVLDGLTEGKWRFLALPDEERAAHPSRRSAASPPRRTRNARRKVNQEQRAADIWDSLVQTAREQRTVAYRDLAAEVGIHHRALTPPLELVQSYCLRERLLPLTSIVVHAKDTRPGTGFIAWDVRNLDAAHELVFRFDWRSLQNPFEYARDGDTEESLADKLIDAPELAADVYRQVKVRGSAQAVFRTALLKAYDGACAFCGFTFTEALDAAHIVPWSKCSGADRMSPSNGLLLCSNHHEMFDVDRLCVSDSYEIIYSGARHPREAISPMDEALGAKLHGRKMRLPSRKNLWPEPAKIRTRYASNKKRHSATP